MNALDWMFQELWNTPKDKWEWNAILNKAKQINVAKVDNTCDKNEEDIWDNYCGE